MSISITSSTLKDPPFFSAPLQGNRYQHLSTQGFKPYVTYVWFGWFSRYKLTIYFPPSTDTSTKEFKKEIETQKKAFIKDLKTNIKYGNNSSTDKPFALGDRSDIVWNKDGYTVTNESNQEISGIDDIAKDISQAIRKLAPAVLPTKAEQSPPPSPKSASRKTDMKPSVSEPNSARRHSSNLPPPPRRPSSPPPLPNFNLSNMTIFLQPTSTSPTASSTPTVIIASPPVTEQTQKKQQPEQNSGSAGTSTSFQRPKMPSQSRRRPTPKKFAPLPILSSARPTVSTGCIANPPPKAISPQNSPQSAQSSQTLPTTSDPSSVQHTDTITPPLPKLDQSASETLPPPSQPQRLSPRPETEPEEEIIALSPAQLRKGVLKKAIFEYDIYSISSIHIPPLNPANKGLNPTQEELNEFIPDAMGVLWETVVEQGFFPADARPFLSAYFFPSNIESFHMNILPIKVPATCLQTGKKIELDCRQAQFEIILSEEMEGTFFQEEEKLPEDFINLVKKELGGELGRIEKVKLWGGTALSDPNEVVKAFKIHMKKKITGKFSSDGTLKFDPDCITITSNYSHWMNKFNWAAYRYSFDGITSTSFQNTNKLDFSFTQTHIPKNKTEKRCQPTPLKILTGLLPHVTWNVPTPLLSKANSGSSTQ